MISTILIALSLSMDAFAVSVSSGICIRELKPFYAFRASFSFGLFQFLMPVLGWYLGSTFLVYISAWDHWIAFILLGFIGGKMLIEALGKKKTEKNGTEGSEPCQQRTEGSDSPSSDIRSLKTLLVLSIATSIDALAVGLSFSILGGGVWVNSGIIGGITFAVCLIGFEFGQRLRRRIGFLFEKWAEAAGGIILIGLGVKILVEHLTAG